MEEIRILKAGDCAVTVEFGNRISTELSAKVTAFHRMLTESRQKGFWESIPTFRSVTVFYNPEKMSYRKVCGVLRKMLSGLKTVESGKKRIFSIPVCYEEEFAPDMESVMTHTGLSKEEIIALHSGRDYRIFMLGFLPGFAYLGGMDERLCTPRLSVPRTRIEAGSVGIGGSQTGIYPLDSPGGWQLIGKTPVQPYEAKRREPILYRAGDYIRFVPISREEYWKIADLCRKGSYQCAAAES